MTLIWVGDNFGFIVDARLTSHDIITETALFSAEKILMWHYLPFPKYSIMYQKKKHNKSKNKSRPYPREKLVRL